LSEQYCRRRPKTFQGVWNIQPIYETREWEAGGDVAGGLEVGRKSGGGGESGSGSGCGTISLNLLGNWWFSLRGLRSARDRFLSISIFMD